MNKITRILLIILGLALVASGLIKIFGALSEEAGDFIPFETSVELSNGAGEPVAVLSTLGLRSDGEREITVVYALENRGEVALTQLNYRLTYLDGEGADLRGKQVEVLKGFMEEPVQPGETRQFEKTHYFDGAERAVSVEIAPICVRDEVELMPWTEPQPGNLLLDFCNYPPFSAHFENLDANPPVKMTYRRGENPEQTVTDPEEILAEIESLRNMRIGGESSVRVTDSDISYWFTMADGEEWGVSFEAPGLFYWHNKVYEVIHD